jgi:xylulokinase
MAPAAVMRGVTAYLCGIDVGTSSTKSVLVDDLGRIIASASQSHPTLSPFPGHQEQNAGDWWDGVCTTVRRVLSQADVRTADIAAVSFSAQGCACQPVDRQGQMLGHALIWTDARSTPQQMRIRELFGAQLGQVTGNDIYDQPEPRMLWMRDNQPDRYRQTHKFLTTVSYLIYRFTGKMGATTSDWGFHLAFDRATRTWNDRFLETVGLDGDKFPRLYESHEIVGGVTAEAALDTGLMAGTPVVAGAQDSVVVALAVGALGVGESVVMRGTTEMLCFATEKGDYHPDLYTTCSVIPGLFVRYDMKEVVASGGSYRWLASMLFDEAGGARYEMMNDLAAASPPGANGLLYLPYLLISTNPDPAQRRAGCYFGLSSTTTRGDLCRAVMEGTAYALRETLSRLAHAGIRIRDLRLTGGPAESALWNQITADVTGLPVLVPAAGSGAAACGAALLAGMGVGVIPMDDGYKTLRNLVTLRQRYEPQAEQRGVYERLYAGFSRLASGTLGIAPGLRSG